MTTIQFIIFLVFSCFVGILVYGQYLMLDDQFSQRKKEELLCQKCKKELHPRWLRLTDEQLKIARQGHMIHEKCKEK